MHQNNTQNSHRRTTSSFTGGRIDPSNFILRSPAPFNIRENIHVNTGIVASSQRRRTALINNSMSPLFRNNQQATNTSNLDVRMAEEPDLPQNQLNNIFQNPYFSNQNSNFAQSFGRPSLFHNNNNNLNNVQPLDIQPAYKVDPQRLFSQEMENQLINELYNLTCSVCYQLSTSMLECQSCEHLFCSNCVLEIRNQNDRCPMKCEQWQLKKAHRIIREKMNNFQFYCQYRNLNDPINGCQEVHILAHLENHEQNCTFRLIECQGCKQKMSQAMLNTHIGQCQLITSSCFKCLVQFKRQDLPFHDCIASLSVVVKNQGETIQKLEETNKNILEKLQQLIEQQQQFQQQLQSTTSQ